MKFLSNTTVDGKLTANIKSYIGQIIFSGTLSTMEKVIEIYGGIKWEKIEGKFLLGASDDYPVNTEGGEATHQLTISEMPSHSHMQNVVANQGGIHSAYNDFGKDQNCMSYYQYANTGATGGDQAHNNMPPYKTMYIWKRTI